MNIVFLDRATLAPNITLNHIHGAHNLIEYSHTPADQIVSRLKNATIAITNKVTLSASILKQLPDLKCICIAATGINNVDIDYCKAMRIAVTNIVDYAIDAVSEHVFMLMLALSKQLKSYNRTIPRGHWQDANQFCYFTSPISLLKGKTLGLIGTGAIAQQTANNASAFGMSCIFHSPSNRHKVSNQLCVPLNQLLQLSDFISIHTPLTDQTNQLIGPDEFKQMKQNCILINTARGQIVNIQALIHALNNQLICAAGLDVLSQEPPLSSDAVMHNLELDNLLITPHVAWASSESMQTLADQLIDKINAFISNSLPPHQNLSAR